MYGRNAYQQSATQTASPAQLVLMLYDGALLRIEQAVEALEESRDLMVAHTGIMKAQRIIDELELSLDHDQGGEIAANLAAIYVYVGELLLEGNLQKEPRMLRDAIEVLTPLRDTWERACVNGPVGAAVAG